MEEKESGGRRKKGERMEEYKRGIFFIVIDCKRTLAKKGKKPAKGADRWTYGWKRRKVEGEGKKVKEWRNIREEYFFIVTDCKRTLAKKGNKGANPLAV